MALWTELREQVEALDPRSELVTPVSGRPFRVESTGGDRVLVRFEDSGESRTLWREQFETVAERVQGEPLDLAGLRPGVEPYVAVLALAGDYVATDDRLEYAPDEGTPGESPFLVPPEAARSRPERLHDDALLLADLLDRIDADDPDRLDTDDLVDLYVLLSDVQRGADDVRRSVRAPLSNRLGPDQSASARFGTVHRTVRERRRLRDEETVLAALDERNIPREWVLGVDRDKLDVVLAATDLEEADVYESDEGTYVQKTGVDEGEKVQRLGGIADRIEDVEGEEGERLREQLDDLEDQLEEALSAG